MKTEICFLGKLCFPYRWRAIRWALRALWLACRGYEAAIMTYDDTPGNREKSGA